MVPLHSADTVRLIIRLPEHSSLELTEVSPSGCGERGEVLDLS